MCIANGVRVGACTLVAWSPDGATFSLAGQLLALVGGVVAGRMLRKRALIFVVSVVAAFLAMAAHILYDGQGACMLLFAAPLIYCFAVIGRDEFRKDRT